MLYIPAKHFTEAHSRDISLLVVHDMEAPEKPTTAEDVAKWFAGNNAPQASAHFCLDNNSIVRSVLDHNIAWAAPGANNDGLHFEFAGYAAQGRTAWLDSFGREMLEIGAHQFAIRAEKYRIPIRKIGAYGIKRGHKGICGHLDITHAFPNVGTHTDPGHDFPWDYFIERVQKWHTKLYG